MKDWRAIAKKFLFPPTWIMILLVIISTIALVSVFVKGWEMLPIAYVTYVVAFYSLVVTCIACFLSFPGYYRKIKQKVYDNKLGKW
jgi:hypothetical protein